MSTTYAIRGPIGEELALPIAVPPDDPYTGLTPEAQKAYYDEHGYVVVRGVFTPEQCRAAVELFRQRVKSYDGVLYRQTSTGLAEPHRFTESGFMLNSLLNPHDLSSRSFGDFRHQLLAMFTAPTLRQPLRRILDDDPVLVQTMYFEGNPATWAHQDTYYLDSNPLGKLAAAWIALEDIHPGAGRFYVYPRSHRLSLHRNTKELNFSQHHDQYKEYIRETIRREGFECRAPALAAGDVLIWSSFTIHGSLATTEPTRSRNSLTAHYIPAHAEFLSFQAKTVPLSTALHNGLRVHHPKDQDRLKNRLVLAAERMFPRPFRAARTAAIRYFTK